MESFVPKGQITGPILPSFVLREKLSAGAKLLYSILCYYAFDKDHCWPSHKTLAQETGYCVSSIKNWLRELKHARLLAIRRTAYSSSTYVLLRPRTEATSRGAGATPSPSKREPNFGYPQPRFGYRKESKVNLEIYPPLPPKDCATPPCAIHARRKRGGGDFISANSIFERLWAVYPRKEAKESARAVWHRLWRCRALPALAELLASLERFRTSRQWLKEHGRFVPFLVNWLRGQRWLEDAPEAGSATTPEREQEVRHCVERLEERHRPDPAIEAARPRFEAFLSCFADGQRKRGPAWGLWSLLHSQGKAPHEEDVDTSMGILDFLTQWRSRLIGQAA